MKTLPQAPNLYVISGCNGAGKTTASYTVLPEMLNCREFVNADNIAAGISPFNPESVALGAGRIMLKRIDELLTEGADFAFETTLATKSYVSLIQKAKALGYKITLVYFWLSSPEEAIERVATRVSKGGHHIPEEVIRRRYYAGINNLVKLYKPICDFWMVVNNSLGKSEIIADGEADRSELIYNHDIWNTIKAQSI
ncbi:zeta toxin family protein [Pedobacter sp. GR22-6]|uniref:zeta toxin family protein n=1 Tax=Pedobacter sp. GR22-6 TaxID=3127957 RepID=UPI00307DDB75